MTEAVALSRFPLVRARGTAAELGRQVGEQARERLHRSLALYERAIAFWAGISWPEARERGLRYVDPIVAFDGELLDELQGLATGAGVDFEDVLALNVRTEIMFDARRPGGVPAECTSFAVLPEAAADGHVYVGQNWDFMPACSEILMVAALERRGRPAFATVVEAGLLGKIGYNAAGIGLAGNLLLSEYDRGEVAVPFHVLLRSVLESTSFEEAVDVVTKARRAASGNYVIASRDGRAVDLETAPGGPEHVRRVEPRAGVIGHANTYLEEWAGHRDVGRELIPTSPARAEAMNDNLDTRRGALDRDALAECLRDHANHPHSVCMHPDPDAPELQQMTSAASMIVDLSEGRMWVADGPPCERPYVEFSLGA